MKKKPIRVLVVEDSITVRKLLVAMLSETQEFEVVGEAGNGADAVEAACRLTPDLITMDVHMPIMDGLDATRQIMHEVPTPIVIVSNSISRSDVDAALNATRAGALMVLAKPGSPDSPEFELQRREFLDMARAMAAVHVVRRWGGGGPSTIAKSSRRASQVVRDGKRPSVKAIAIGTSTGGPAALQRIIEDLPDKLPVPVLVVQHMAHGFLRGLADWLSDSTKKRIVLAEEGGTFQPGLIYVAPDNRHLGVNSSGRVQFSDNAATNGFRPSADHLFHSCAAAYGPALVAVILTGMGQDGVAGLHSAHAAGAHVIAQDEESSVVFGMAQVAVQAGVVDEVLPLDQIGRRLASLVSPTEANER